MSFKTIAIDCGFNNYAHFSGSFKRYKGVSPKEYREQTEKQKLLQINKNQVLKTADRYINGGLRFLFCRYALPYSYARLRALHAARRPIAAKRNGRSAPIFP